MAITIVMERNLQGYLEYILQFHQLLQNAKEWEASKLDYFKAIKNENTIDTSRDTSRQMDAEESYRKALCTLERVKKKIEGKTLPPINLKTFNDYFKVAVHLAQRAKYVNIGTVERFAAILGTNVNDFIIRVWKEADKPHNFFPHFFYEEYFFIN